MCVRVLVIEVMMERCGAGTCGHVRFRSGFLLMCEDHKRPKTSGDDVPASAAGLAMRPSSQAGGACRTNIEFRRDTGTGERASAFA